MSEQKSNIYKKLFEAKKEIGKISKDTKNPFFKSKYFDINSLLEHVEPILQKHELLLLQPIVNNHQQTVIIDIETGEKEISQIELSNITDPQKKGSEITYFRRYTAQSLLGLQAKDDDANLASNPTSTNNAKPSKANEYEKPWLNKTDKEKNFTKQWLNVVEAINKGTIKDVAAVCEHYKVSKAVKEELNQVFNHKSVA